MTDKTMEFKGTPAPWIISDSGHSIMDSEQFIFADVRRHAILCRWHEKDLSIGMMKEQVRILELRQDKPTHI